jgi:hypothetical protein
MVDYKEAVDMSKVTKYKMISIKGDQKEITIDREDLEKHLKLGYVIKEPLTEENEYVAVHVKKGETSVTANSSYEAAKKASEKFGLKNTAGVTVYLTKKDGKEIIHKATEEVEIQEEPKLNQKELDKFHTSLDKLVHKTFGSSSDEKKKQEPKKEEVKEPTGDLKDACWTGYVAVGTKMKNGKRVPNCVPKSEAYKGAKAIVENAFKKLKEKK